MRVLINTVDITGYIAFQGFKWQRADVAGPNAGRSIDNAYLFRDRIAIKNRLDITCRPLTGPEASTILKLIEPEYVTVTYYDPQEGKEVTKQMYSNNLPASFLIRRKDGTELWGGITSPLIER